MVTIEQYRSAIGAFASVSRKVKEQIDNIKGIDVDELYEEFDHMPHVLLHFWKEYVLHCLGIYRTINEAILKWKLLNLLNDTEMNPGPEMERVVAGSFHQGNQKFGNLVGRQCCAISLYGLALSTIKDVKRWTRDTLDSVMEHGTALYDKIGKYEFLAVEDLPSVVEIFDEPINVKFKFNSHGILSRENRNMDILKGMICRNAEVTGITCDSGFFLWLSENCVSVMVKKQLTHVEFILLDPHARDEEGRVSSNGVSVLLFFKGVSSLVNYLCDTYLGDSNDKLIGYQIQFVNCFSTMSKEKHKKIVQRQIQVVFNII